MNFQIVKIKMFEVYLNKKYTLYTKTDLQSISKVSQANKTCYN